MKTPPLMLFILFFTIILLSCETENPHTVCEIGCENETIQEELNKVSAKIIKVCTNRNEAGVLTNCIYAISTDEAWLDKETWPEPSDNILVPCNGIPREFQTVNLKVTISGIKKSCCNLLTKPEIWGAYGCKFELKSIESLTN